MKRQFQNLQRSLFDEDKPPVVLATTQMELATLVDALLLEIAAALANGGLGDDPRSPLSILSVARTCTSVSRLPINLCTITKAGDGNTGSPTARGSSVGLR